MNLEVGSVIGDYQIVAILGAGGMGKVFKVRNTIFDRIEAMKVLLPDLSGEPDLADRFLREIKVLAALNHPNIAGLRTAVRFENQLLMIMEYVEGVSLDERLQQGPLPVNEAVTCISQVLSALGYAHAHGVIHRDIKPANMMVTPDGTVKLMDFGIAKSATDRKLTMTGTTMGSLYYMSPEQIRGVQTLDSRSDLYSVGVSLYELVTGKHPFDGDSQFSIMSAHLEQTPVPPVSVNPALPAALSELILFSVSREPDARFQNAEAFRNALNSVAGLPASAAAAPKPAAAAPPPPRVAPTVPLAAPVAASVAAPQAKKAHRGLWLTAGALVFAAVLIAAIQFGPWKKAAANSAPAPAAAVAPPLAAAPVAVSPAATPPVETAPSVPQPTASPAVQQAEPVARTSKPVPTPSRQQVPIQAAPAAGNQPPAQVVQQPAAPVQAPPQAPAVQAAPQPDQAAQRAELQKVRMSLVTLSARSSSIHSTLDGLQRSQAASGYGLRGDWLQAASLMDSFLTGANEALAASDAASAKDLLEKAQHQVTFLEKALNK